MCCLCQRNAYIHTEKTGYDRWHSHHQCNGCQVLHDIIQPVIDHRRQQLPGSVDNITVNTCHLDRLLVLYDNIIQKLFILRVLLQSLIAGQAIQYHRICSQGGCKIYKCGLQRMKIDQVNILRISINPFLDLCSLFINDPQCTLIQRSYPEQYLIYKTKSFFGTKLLHSSQNKGLQHRRILRADCNNGILCQYNTQRNCGICFFIHTDLRRWNIYQDQRIAILQFNTGALLFIQRRQQI